MTTSTPTSSTVEDAGPEPSSLPGFWMMVLGSVLAVLAPLAGFLAGSVTGVGPVDRTSTLGLWLTVGLVVGGLGVLVAFVGGTRWWRAAHS